MGVVYDVSTTNPIAAGGGGGGGGGSGGSTSTLAQPVKIVRLASTVDLNLAAMPATIDGVAAVVGDRFGAFGQATASQGGLYNFNGAGAAATRVTDFSTSANMVPGTLVVVTEGASLADTLWEFSSDPPIVVGVTAIDFKRLDSGAGGFVPATRAINTVAPLAGGGNLTADRTLSLTINATLQVVAAALGVVYGLGANTALEGSNDALYVHKAGTETITGAKLFTASPRLANAVPLQGTTTAAASVSLAQVSAADRAEFGDASLDIRLTVASRATLSALGTYAIRDDADAADRAVASWVGDILTLGDVAPGTLGTLVQTNALGTVQDAFGGATHFLTSAGGAAVGNLAVTQGANTLAIGGHAGAATTTKLYVTGPSPGLLARSAVAVDQFAQVHLGDPNFTNTYRGGYAYNRRATAANTTLAASDTLVAVTNTAAPRTVSVDMTGASQRPGQFVFVMDESGAASATNPITVAPTAGTIDGGASVAIDFAGGSVMAVSDGTNLRTVSLRLNAAQDGLYVHKAGTETVTGAKTFTTLQSFAIDDATTAAVTDVVQFVHTTTGAAAAGIAAGALFRAENDAGATVDAARVAGVLTTATAGSEGGALDVYTRTGPAALSSKFRFDGGGGFFLRTGTTATTLGAVGIGLPNNTGLYFRNSIDSAWVDILYLDGSNQIQFGTNNNVLVLSSFSLNATAQSGMLSLNAQVGTIDLKLGNVTTAQLASASAWVFGQGEGGVPTAFTVRGANASGNNVAGAVLTYQAGLPTGNAADNYLSLQGSIPTAAGAGQHTAGESARVYGRYFVLKAGFSQGRTTVADANYTALVTDRRIAYTSISTARTVTGPTTTGVVPAGVFLEYLIVDESGSASSTNTITFTPASGTIDGAASAVVVAAARGETRVWFDGTNWHTAVPGAGFVTLSTAQTITGAKTFNASPIIATGVKLLGAAELTLEAQGATNKVFLSTNGAQRGSVDQGGGLNWGAQAIASPLGGGGIVLSNNFPLYSRTSGGTLRTLIFLSSTDVFTIGDGNQAIRALSADNAQWDVAGNRYWQLINTGANPILALGNFEGITSSPVKSLFRNVNTATGGGNNNLAGGDVELGAGLGTGSGALSKVILSGPATNGTANAQQARTEAVNFTSALGTFTCSVLFNGQMRASYTDSSGTPGDATQNTNSGRAAFAAAGTTVTITSNKVVAASVVLVQLEDADATLTRVTVAPAAGSFVVTGNAAATATTKFRWWVINS